MVVACVQVGAGRFGSGWPPSSRTCCDGWRGEKKREEVRGLHCCM